MGTLVKHCDHIKPIEQENKKNSPFSPQPKKIHPSVRNHENQQLHPSSPLRHVDTYI
jgi:hypothetical protein